MLVTTPNQVFAYNISLEGPKEGQIMQKISFEFKGKTYEVGMDAYRRNLPIRLPDGRVLTVMGGWLESMPPQPRGLDLLECTQAVEVLEV